MYGHLFTTEEPSDEHWEAELNPLSEVVYSKALADPSIMGYNPVPEWHVQVSLECFVTFY